MNRLRKYGRMVIGRARYTILFHHRRPGLYQALVGLKNKTAGGIIRLEASSVCQLKCRVCSTASGKNRKGIIGWGFLAFEHFKQVVDENPWIRRIELSNWGEIFLNPDILPIMRYAHARNVELTAVNGVNLNKVSDEVLEALVKYKFHHMSISLDGASHETYKQYRAGGSYNRVLRNIERINHFKRVYRSKLPKLSWQFIIFGHNEHELAAARQKAKELDMHFRSKLNHTPVYSPVKNAEFVRREGGHNAATRDEFRQRKKRDYSSPCIQMWDSPQINWDGALLGCCVNKFGSFGNVFEQGLQAALQNEAYRYAKLMVLGLKPPREDIPCYHCKTYRRLMGMPVPVKHKPPKAPKTSKNELPLITE